jgi:hypothetical protein
MPHLGCSVGARARPVAGFRRWCSRVEREGHGRTAGPNWMCGSGCVRFALLGMVMVLLVGEGRLIRRSRRSSQRPAGADTVRPHEDAAPARLSRPRGCLAESPTQPGCERCCIVLPGSCAIHSTDPRFDEYGRLAYRLTERRPGSCSPSCPACARCSDHAENELRARHAARPECDCTLPLDEDACFWSSSCSCFCERLLPFTRTCPSFAGPM